MRIMDRMQMQIKQLAILNRAVIRQCATVVEKEPNSI